MYYKPVKNSTFVTGEYNLRFILNYDIEKCYIFEFQISNLIFMEWYHVYISLRSFVLTFPLFKYFYTPAESYKFIEFPALNYEKVCKNDVRVSLF